ncbi:MAG: peptidylprolyl isomerase [Lachnospiraceae bacterium]|nr:peptidylprolyl isomerase [Robinsoniella sp.]MDY3767057.1 peptidylprolyl isomerase [Lachnospiraceae bacterium]
MNQFTKKLMIAGMCVCVTASTLTGCGVKSDSTVATVNGDKIPYGLLNFVVRYNQAQYEPFYTAYGAYFGLSSDVSVWEQSMDGETTLGENMKNEVLESLEEMYLMEDHMAEYNVTITSEEREAMEKAADEFLASNDQATLDAMTADKDTVVRMLELDTIYVKMQAALYDSADTEISDEEAAQRGITTAFFSIETSVDATPADATDGDAQDEATPGEATPGDATDAAKEKAQKVLDELKKGKEFEEVLQKVDDTITATYTTYGEDDIELSEEIKAAADALTEEGQVAEELVEADDGYYVVQLTTALDREATDEKKEEMILDRQSEAFDTAIEGWKEGADISVKTKVLAKIDFKDSMSTVYTEEEEEMTPADATIADATDADASPAEAQTEE